MSGLIHVNTMSGPEMLQIGINFCEYFGVRCTKDWDAFRPKLSGHAMPVKERVGFNVAFYFQSPVSPSHYGMTTDPEPEHFFWHNTCEGHIYVPAYASIYGLLHELAHLVAGCGHTLRDTEDGDCAPFEYFAIRYLNRSYPDINVEDWRTWDTYTGGVMDYDFIEQEVTINRQRWRPFFDEHGCPVLQEWYPRPEAALLAHVLKRFQEGQELEMILTTATAGLY